ncbi:hypothetical protein WL510_14255, partial [Staphylococcus saprophyticus]
AYYEKAEDKNTLKVLHAIRDNTKVNLVDSYETPTEHIYDIDALYEQQYAEEWLARTDEIANMCDAKLEYHQALLPEFV